RRNPPLDKERCSPSRSGNPYRRARARGVLLRRPCGSALRSPEAHVGLLREQRPGVVLACVKRGVQRSEALAALKPRMPQLCAICTVATCWHHEIERYFRAVSVLTVCPTASTDASRISESRDLSRRECLSVVFRLQFALRCRRVWPHCLLGSRR